MALPRHCEMTLALVCLLAAAASAREIEGILEAVEDAKCQLTTSTGTANILGALNGCKPPPPPSPTPPTSTQLPIPTLPIVAPSSPPQTGFGPAPSLAAPPPSPTPSRPLSMTAPPTVAPTSTPQAASIPASSPAGILPSSLTRGIPISGILPGPPVPSPNALSPAPSTSVAPSPASSPIPILGCAQGASTELSVGSISGAPSAVGLCPAGSYVNRVLVGGYPSNPEVPCVVIMFCNDPNTYGISVGGSFGCSQTTPRPVYITSAAGFNTVAGTTLSNQINSLTIRSISDPSQVTSAGQITTGSTPFTLYADTNELIVGFSGYQTGEAGAFTQLTVSYQCFPSS